MLKAVPLKLKPCNPKKALLGDDCRSSYCLADLISGMWGYGGVKNETVTPPMKLFKSISAAVFTSP
jgi:hypothetical protein